MIYSELQATVSATGECDSSASGDPVGPCYAAKTIGYSSRFLAYGTVTFPGLGCDEQYVEDGFHTIDFSKLYYTPIVTTTTYKDGCSPYANPRLSLPADLTDIVPAWQTCQPLFYGAFDPPSVLTKASGLAPAQAGPAAVTPTPSPVPALPAVAQATPAAVTPAATIAPHNDGPKAAPVDPPASVVDTNEGIPLNVNTNKVLGTPAVSSEDRDRNSQGGGPANDDPSGHSIAFAAVVANSAAQGPTPVTHPTSQKPAAGSEDPTSPVIGPAAAVVVKSPVRTPESAANVVVAQGTTLTENGLPASIGGKVALYSSGSVYVDSTPVPVAASARVTPANVVVAQGQTLTEGGPSAKVGGKPVVYSAGSVYYDSTPLPIPTASPTNLVVAQGQTLTENGPSAVVGGKTALFKAGSLYYDSTPIAVPTSAQGQKPLPPVLAAGITFVQTVRTPSPAVTNGITFTPAVQQPSPVVAGGITFAPISQGLWGDASDPVVAGGITLQPSHTYSSNAVALDTLSVGTNPVLKFANGDLIVAGTMISLGGTTKLLGHTIAANSEDVVVDGTTHSLAPATAYPIETPTVTPLAIANRPVSKAANGDLVIADSTISLGSATNFLGHVISVGINNVVLDGTTHTFGPTTAHPFETPAPLEIASQPARI